MIKLRKRYFLYLLLIFFSLSGIIFSNELKDLKVSEVSFTKLNDIQRGIEKGYTLSFVGDLQQPVLKVLQGEIRRVVTDNGENLLSKDRWARTFSVVLSENKKRLYFEIRLKMPDKAKSFKEISGSLNYLVSKGYKKVDLDISQFTKGTKGKLESEIKNKKPSKWNKGSEEIELYLKIPYLAIEKITFYDESGKEIQFAGWGGYGTKDSTTRTFIYNGSFPQKGKIEVEYYEGIQEKEIPFKIHNINLLGDPVK